MSAAAAPSQLSEYNNSHYRHLFTDCVASSQEQCNEFIDPSCLTPSSGYSSGYEQDLGHKHELPAVASFEPDTLEQQPTGILASQTPGLPQLGVDVEFTPLNSFFMNPFASVSFPGDIPLDEFGPAIMSRNLPMADWSNSSSSSTVFSSPPGITITNTDADLVDSVWPQKPQPIMSLDHFFPSHSYDQQADEATEEPVTNTSVTPTTTSPLLPPPTFPPPSTTRTPTPPQPSPPKSSSDPPSPPAKASSTPTFQFVDASDRKTIMKIRNTMVSRKHRDNKVKRIAELEKLLAERDAEIAELKRLVKGR
ncbi:uncharacterized protein AB675_7131 [Cyphellophora attinorum]|uniref:BZIP domain-containing protein n=1 Tax=Cyphellophora attinorum TaxID=1664694 RepID=A0A0N0NQ91_9EURO|nr:uncharacterized protein AB675_7131 [Phialophora attinorum]KPI43429.1 hypothetical protein AB675_7131 [Phialophora attinorum]